jgi:hypothetical protein
MDFREVDYEDENDYGIGSCPVASFCIGSTEPSVSTRQIIFSRDTTVLNY